MNRRHFLANLGLLVAAGVVADKLELLDMLAPRRLYVPGADFGLLTPSPSLVITEREWSEMLRNLYSAYRGTIPTLITPLAPHMTQGHRGAGVYWDVVTRS